VSGTLIPGRKRSLSRQLQEKLGAAYSPAFLRSCSRVGTHSNVLGRPYVENLGYIEIGERFHLSSKPVQSHMVTGPNGRLIIGDDVFVEYGAAVASHGQVTIGSRVRLGPYVMIMDTDFHDVVARDVLPDGGVVTIGDDVTVGSQVTILKGSIIGPGATIAAGSVVASPIPAGATAAGVPARVVNASADPTRLFSSEVAGDGTIPDSGAITERIRRKVQVAFALDSLPDPTTGPDTIMAWDSLRTLTLLLDLEEEFHISLPEAEMLRARNLLDISAMILRALERGRS